MLLLALADFASDDGVAWPGLERLAAAILKDKRTVQRLIAQLQRDGWMEVCPRTAPVRMADGHYENRGTSYKINLAKLRGVLPSRQGEDSAAGAEVRWSGAVENARRDDKTADPRRQNQRPETTKSTPRDDKNVAPLITSQEPSENHQREIQPPLPPAVVPNGGKSKSAHQAQEQKQATAKTTASATAPAMRPAEVSTQRAGETSRSSGGRVIPFRDRRDPEQLRARLDGFEAALFDETMRVLGECGIGPTGSTRRMRNAVSDALQAGAAPCLADAVAHLVRQWDEYLAASPGLTKLVGVQRFFADGYWKNRALWDWSLETKASWVQHSNASVGMHQSARNAIDEHDRAKRQWEAERAQR